MLFSTTVATSASLCLLMAGCGTDTSSSPAATATSGTPPSGSATTTPMNHREDFLSSYVASDGRVLRHDQGDDVVSEGQAYGMLVAELAGRDDVVRTIWSWTRAHLSTADGLLSYHADALGTVLDPQPASDADVLASYALLRYAGSGAAELHRDGRGLASSVLAHETVTDSSGRPVLAAGPWATSDPAVVNPSYWMPGIFDEIARLTGDARWDAMAVSSVDLVAQATDDGRRLPPDWARLEGDQVVPTGAGGGSGTPQYGPDAQRVPLWFAAACDAPARALAARWWTVLEEQSRSSATALSLSGDVIDASGSAVGLLAARASALAAGDDAGAASLREGAVRTDEGNPTYYGGAWLALADGLREGRLSSCDRGVGS